MLLDPRAYFLTDMRREKVCHCICYSDRKECSAQTWPISAAFLIKTSQLKSGSCNTCQNSSLALFIHSGTSLAYVALASAENSSKDTRSSPV